MLKIIRRIMICLLGFANTGPAIADESLSVQVPPVPTRNISIKAIETTFAVSPSSPEVDPEYVKRYALAYFADIPVMIAIAECETKFEHYRPDGTLNVNRGVTGKGKRAKRVSSATGVYQITFLTHFDGWARSNATNITTMEGNFAYARQMYEESGTSPWNESKACWESKTHKYDTRVASN